MRYFFPVILCISLICCVPTAQSSVNSRSNPKTLQLADLTYEPEIKTVRLYPGEFPLRPAVIRLGESTLTLEFDDLRDHYETYYARLINCHYDWTESGLQDLDFLTAYNEFPVNTYEFSVDTHIPYVHYKVNVPQVKVSGNYVIAVYRGNDKDDIILTKRFMVFENRVSLLSNGNLIGPGSIANLNQQINFTVAYKNMNIPNPMMDMHVNIRQNQRWDNEARDVRPSFIREIEKELDYNFFDDEKMFKGGNEFRFFDLRSLNYPGRNVAYINKTVKPFEAYIAKDKSRYGDVYSQYDDINGNYILENYDYRDASFSNYVKVNFSLASPPIKGDVYVTGAFTQWSMSNENKMRYDSAQHLYTASALMKQGWYDYQYIVKAKGLPWHYLEGSHFETENYYEIFVYTRSYLAPVTDLLVGYVMLQKNAR